MAHLKRSFKPDHIWFADDIFGFRVDWVAEFAAARAGRGRPDSLHHPNARGLGQRAHGRSAARRRMPGGVDRRGKRQPAGVGRHEQGHHGGRNPRRARSGSGRSGIRVGFFIQLGYMDEQLADILATRDLLDAARPDEIGVSVSYPLPGTQVLRAGQGAVARQDALAGEQRSGNDVSGNLHVRFLSSRAKSLHEQISLQTAPRRRRTTHARARSALDRRWRELLRTRASYRSPDDRSAAGLRRRQRFPRELLPPPPSVAASLRKITETLARELASPTQLAPDWTEFEWILARAVTAMHGVSPLLSRALHWRGPGGWTAISRGQRAHTAKRHARIDELLRRLDRRTRGAGIAAAVALKGAALHSMGLYAAGDRPMADIDLLVRPADASAPPGCSNRWTSTSRAELEGAGVHTGRRSPSRRLGGEFG